MGKRPKNREPLELQIERLAFGARGVARKDDFVWFVDRAIPGQKVLAKPRRTRKSYGEAYVIEVLEPSPFQVEPPCPYFGVCGGCQLQHLDYEKQIQAKTEQIQDILQRLGGISDVKVKDCIPCESTYGYRNKMEFTFSDRRWVFDDEPPDVPKNFALGLHVPRRYDKVINIDECHLQSEICNRILRATKTLIKETGLPPYNIKNHQGFYRFLVIREGKNTGEILLNLITSGQFEEGQNEVGKLAEKLLKKHPELTTFIHSISDKQAQIAFGDSEQILLGSGKIQDKIGDRVYEISPNAFFQTNTKQTEILFKTICKLADLKGDEIVHDLYCGTGAIGIYLANKVKKVWGIEMIADAIENAKRNVELNGLTNLEFILADMKDALRDIRDLAMNVESPDVVILDPPRGGTHPKTIKHLLNLGSPKIVYVSCNPAILARDLQILCEKQYKLMDVQPVDMFPHTGHIETVTLLHHI